MNDALVECQELFKLRSDFYEAIDVKVAAVKFGQSWFNIRTKILPVAKKAIIKNKIPIDTQNFRIIHDKLSPKEFFGLLNSISKGFLEIEGFRIGFFSEPFPQLLLEDYGRGDSGRSKERWKINFPVDLFEWRATHKLHNQLAKIYKEIDMRLHCFDPPYSDINEAVRGLLELPSYHFEKNQSRDSRCIVILPNFVAIESAKLKGNKLAVTVKIHESIAPEDLFLSIIGYGHNTIRFREGLKNGKIEKISPFLRISKSFELDDIADAELFLFSREMEKLGHSDQKKTRNIKSRLNPLVAAHEIFDSESMKLRERLLGKSKREVQRTFEHAVVTLFNMCGFWTEWLDFQGMTKEAPDFLAFFSDPELVVVGECTTKKPDDNKYQLLKERSEVIRTQLEVKVIPAMFTSKSASHDEKTKTALHYDVTIVTPKELLQLHEMATRARPIKEILNVLTGRYW